VSLEPQVEHPVRLTLQPGDVGDHVIAQPAPRRGTREVGSAVLTAISTTIIAAQKAPTMMSAGATPKLGRVDDGSTVTDYDEEEIARTLSTQSLVEGNRAVVDARLISFGEPNHFRYEFERDGEGWRVDEDFLRSIEVEAGQLH
jgi:hypothetical protein